MNQHKLYQRQFHFNLINSFYCFSSRLWSRWPTRRPRTSWENIQSFWQVKMMMMNLTLFSIFCFSTWDFNPDLLINLFSGLVQSKICDDLETLPAKKLNHLLAKNMIPINNLRRLSFESRHDVVDKKLEHVETMMKLSAVRKISETRQPFRSRLTILNNYIVFEWHSFI